MAPCHGYGEKPSWFLSTRKEKIGRRLQLIDQSASPLVLRRHGKKVDQRLQLWRKVEDTLVLEQTGSRQFRRTEDQANYSPPKNPQDAFQEKKLVFATRIICKRLLVKSGQMDSPWSCRDVNWRAECCAGSVPTHTTAEPVVDRQESTAATWRPTGRSPFAHALLDFYYEWSIQVLPEKMQAALHIRWWPGDVVQGRTRLHCHLQGAVCCRHVYSMGRGMLCGDQQGNIFQSTILFNLSSKKAGVVSHLETHYSGVIEEATVHQAHAILT